MTMSPAALREVLPCRRNKASSLQGWSPHAARAIVRASPEHPSRHRAAVMSPMEKIVPSSTENLTPPTHDPSQGEANDVGAEFRTQVGRYNLIRLLGRGGMG